MKKDSNFVSAVIYVHNEEERIVPFLREVQAVLAEHFEHYEIICVNDASDDHSVEQIRTGGLDAQSSSVSILHMSHFHGLELAMHAGVDLAIGDYVFEFDSVLMDYEREEIIRVYQRSLEGYDMVSASPDQKSRLSSRLFYRLLSNRHDRSERLTTERFRVMSRRMINRISGMNRTMPYRKVVYAASGLQVDHLVYHSNGQVAARDRQEEGYRRSLAINALIMFTNVGYRFAVALTIIMMCFTVAVLIYTVVCFLTINPVAGWTSMILFLSVAFFGLFAILTVIIRYLQVLVDLVFKQSQYTVENVEKLSE